MIITNSFQSIVINMLYVYDDFDHIHGRPLNVDQFPLELHFQSRRSFGAGVSPHART